MSEIIQKRTHKLQVVYNYEINKIVPKINEAYVILRVVLSNYAWNQWKP